MWRLRCHLGQHPRQCREDREAPRGIHHERTDGAIGSHRGAVVTMLGDSRYVVQGMTEWLPGWKVRGWKAADGKPVANAELRQALVAAVARHESVTWEWVEGARRARAEREGGQDRERGSGESLTTTFRAARDST